MKMMVKSLIPLLLLASPLLAKPPETTKRESVRVAFVGDIMMHKRVQQQPVIYSRIAPRLKSFDWVHANLESPLAPGITADFRVVEDPGPVFDDLVYTGFPRFNAHPDVLIQLKEAGIRSVSTANNHAMDRGSRGVDLTIDALQSHQLFFSGTRRSDTPDAPFHISQTIDGFAIAFLACTYGTQGPPDRRKQVSLCHDPTLLDRISQLAQNHNAVFVLPHWGDEYQPRPNKTQQERSRVFLEAGATAVVSTHPHVLQPLEFYTTTDGRHTVIAHSLGNFVSNQQRLERRTSVILELELESCKTTSNAPTRACIKATHIHPIRTLIQKQGLRVLPVDAREHAPAEWDHVESVFGVCMMPESKSQDDCK